MWSLLTCGTNSDWENFCNKFFFHCPVDKWQEQLWTPRLHWVSLSTVKNLIESKGAHWKMGKNFFSTFIHIFNMMIRHCCIWACYWWWRFGQYFSARMTLSLLQGREYDTQNYFTLKNYSPAQCSRLVFNCWTAGFSYLQHKLTWTWNYFLSRWRRVVSEILNLLRQEQSTTITLWSTGS